MAKFPAITIRMGADVARLRKDLKKGEGIIGSFSKFGANALMGLTAGAGAAAVALGVDSVKAALADDKAARKLEQTILNTTKATKEQTAGVEDYITKTMFATGVADDELRPAMARLLRSTKSITKSQELLNLAMDISAGTGKPLETVVNALGKGYDGNNASLGRLGLGVDAAILKQKDFGKVTDDLKKNFKGFAENEANTMEGRIDRLTLRFGEAKEEMGKVLLEGLEPLFEFMDSPEGKQFMEDFAVLFAESMKIVAELLPGIVKEIGKVVSSVAKVGIAQTLFDDPRLLVAGAAYGAGFAFGGPVGGALAAIAAYQMGSAIQEAGASPQSQAGVSNRLGKAQKGFNASGVEFQGTFSDYAMRGSGWYQAQLGAGQSVNSGGYTGSNFAGGGVRQNVTINVTSLDPAGAARAVQQALNKTKRMGVSRLSGAAG